MKIRIAQFRRKKEKTEELAESDNKRDSFISSLKLFARAFIVWNNEHSEQAKKIYELIKKHGLRMTEENYQEESALIESLLNDLEKPENTTAIEALNLTALVADLRAEQTNFNSLMLESAQLEAGKSNFVSATEIKRKMHETFIKTVNYLNVMGDINKETFGATVSEVAELVNNLNQKIRNRKNK